jgi:hypothetical protein
VSETDAPVKSIWAEEDGSVIGYMCYIDWECELGGASGGNRVYPTIENLKANHTCWEECGIVEVRVSWSKTILPLRFSEEETISEQESKSTVTT